MPSAKSARNPPTCIHVQTDARTGFSANSAPSWPVPTPKAIINATIVETRIVPHATKPLNISLYGLSFRYPPISQLITAPASGAKMIRLKRLFSAIQSHVFFLGRRTSSPPQFGHTEFISWTQSPQNVHSKVQIYASAVSVRARPHFSHFSRISSAITSIKHEHHLAHRGRKTVLLKELFA